MGMQRTDYLNTVAARIQKLGHHLCLGVDPVRDRIPVAGDLEQSVTFFVTRSVEALIASDLEPVAVKANLAYYEQYAEGGLACLRRLMELVQRWGIPVILDGKRGDIGRSSVAQAAALFDALGADAVTVSPFMGWDSIQPFLGYADQGKGVYVLVRTSNPGAEDLQELTTVNGPLYQVIAGKLLQWYRRGLGAVVGATNLQQLSQLCRILKEAPSDFGLLVPGVGAQGGSGRDVLATIQAECPTLLDTTLVNVGSSILFAHEKLPPGALHDDFTTPMIAEARRQIQELRQP